MEPAGGGFATTRWSIVLAAGGRTGESRAALETLCRSYWYPLYAFARRSGHPTERAQDLVQGFFTHLLEKEALESADPERGRFRSFLLASFKNYAANERAREAAAMRGGGRLALALDGAEDRFAAQDAPPERQFEREWAVSLLDRALERVRESYVARGQGTLFDALKGALVPDSVAHAELGRAAGLTEGAARVAVHRLRDRFRRALREEVADTVGDEARVEDEIRDLLAALAAP